MSGATRVLHEAQLTREEVSRILRICGADALLVGGQSLAVWAVYYNVQPVGVLSLAVTTDADFIGTREVARALQRQLGDPWKLREGTLDDAGAQVAKVYAAVSKDGIKQVDFLSGIVGLETEKVRARATQLVLADGLTIHVLHPLDVLESRLANLATLPSKQNAIGVEQTRLALSIVRAFLESHMNAGGDPRILRQAVKRIEKIALDGRLSSAAFMYRIDVLAAIPVARIAYPRFQEEQWPRMQQRLAAKRERFDALQARRNALRGRTARSTRKK